MCNYLVKINESMNSCKLGLHGGRPSNGVCKYCISRGENTPEHAAKIKATAPTISQQAASLGKSLLNWTSSGFTATPPDSLAEREATCRACPQWDAEALNKTGRCKICGCSTWAKLRMATEKCPIDKWGPITPELTERKKTDEKDQAV